MYEILTYTKKMFNYADPDPSQVCIEDIAQSLSMQCRFNGGVDRFYSVAQHCVIGSLACESQGKQYALEFLLHDATEAYIGDVPSPAKRMLPDFQRLEQEIWEAAIAPKYGLGAQLSETVTRMDRIMLDAEMNLFLNRRIDSNSLDPEESARLLKVYNFESIPPEEVKKLFLKRFHELTS